MNQDKIKEFAKEFDISEKLAEEILSACSEKNLNETIIKGKVSNLVMEYNKLKDEGSIDEGLTPYVRRTFFEYIGNLNAGDEEFDVDSSYYEKISKKIDNISNDLLNKIEQKGNGNIFNIFLPASIILFIVIILFLFLTDGFDNKPKLSLTAAEDTKTQFIKKSSEECYKDIFKLTKNMEPKDVFLSSAIIEREGACGAYDIMQKLFKKSESTDK